MAFNLSPSVNIIEKDLSTFVSGVSNSVGALVGDFAWGPANEITLVSNEESLVNLFGLPDDVNYKSWYTASNFLAYSNNLKLVRTLDATAKNASDGTSQGDVVYPNELDIDYSTWAANNQAFAAKYAGTEGNKVGVSVCQRKEFDAWTYKAAFDQYPQGDDIYVAVTLVDNGGTTNVVESFALSLDPTSKDGFGVKNYIQNALENNSKYLYASPAAGSALDTRSAATAVGAADGITTENSKTLTSATGGFQISEAAISVTAASADIDVADGSLFFPGSIVVITGLADTDDNVTTSVVSISTNTLTLAHTFISTEATAATALINTVVVDDQITLLGLNAGVFDVESIVDDNTLTISQRMLFSDTGVTYSFQGTLAVSGLDSALSTTSGLLEGGLAAACTAGNIITGWTEFSNAESVDVALAMEGGVSGGDASKLVANHIIENIAEQRKDCIAFVSPEAGIVSGTTQVTDIIATRNLLPSSSYGFMDANYKFQYDRFNDKFRWVPLNGDMAGVSALAEETNDAWYSPAGYTRGSVKNVTKLAFNPTKAQRDDLYVSNVNAVITQAGEGTILFGDKTLQTHASAFDRINVRRLFIVIEKSIANAAKFNLFEFNDAFTRARFVQTVTPFLRDVQSRRGVTDFSVIADETVNTAQVIDANEFRATILIKPNKSINYINLTFTAVASGVSFDEITV